MAFTYIANKSYDSASSASIVVDKPIGTDEWDIMVAMIWTNVSWYTTAQPTWWVLLWKQFITAFYIETRYKVAGVSEWSDYTRTPVTTSKVSWTIATYRGWFNTSDPIDVISNTVYQVDNTTVRAAWMTVTDANSPLIICGWVYDNKVGRSFTKPTAPTSDWTEDLEIDSNLVSNFTRSFDSMVWSSSWATWDMDMTLNASYAYKWAFAVSLNPDAVPANTTNFFNMF